MPRTKDTTQKDAAMQDAELFFQAADHRHLFLYIDGLAETEARRQADVCSYVKKHLDDYEALQKEVKRLKQELQQEKDANALLQTQLAQQSREAAVHSSQKTTTEDKQAGTAPAQDNAEDWYRLGKQYACGEGVPQDDDRACQWYAKAAAQGHEAGLSVLKQLAKQGYVAAQYCLGDMYNYGEGVPRNGDIACQWYAKAAATFKEAAEQGDAEAQFCLGDMYKEGKGVPRNNARAQQWYAKAAATLKKAAEQGNDDAQYRLGTIYKEGKGVPRDGAGARQWYTKAAATFTKAAEQGDAEAQFRLGDMYKKGIGVPRNGDIACQWYAKAAAQGHDAGLNALTQLAERGHADAQYRLGTMYKEGRGVPQDDGRACQWYAKAAAQGHNAGLNALTQLAEQGNADAQYCLGCMYRKGEGLLQDYDLARRWFEKAIAQGHADALNDFGKMY